MRGYCSRAWPGSGALRPRHARIIALASLIGIGSGCSAGPDERARIERELAVTTARTLGVDSASAACTGLPDGHRACVVAAAGRDPFVAEVQGRDDGGALRWRAIGMANIEFVIARGVARELGVEVTAARCPRTGCVGDGFECAVVLADGTEIPVDISQVEDGERFRWQTRGVIAKDTVESLVRERLDESRRDARIDCGPRLRPSRPGTMFSCTIAPVNGSASGPHDAVEIRVIDWDGRVSVGDLPGSDRAGGGSGGAAAGSGSEPGGGGEAPALGN